MKNVVKSFILGIMIFIVPFCFVLAHPGNTDSNGCHTCRTNCAKWGLSDGQYHCHNSGNSSGSSSSNSYNQTTTRTTTKKQVYGCMNKEATNYNSNANVANGSCLFEKIETKIEVINYETEVQGELKTGNKKIIQEGIVGERTITIKTITNESGEETSSEVISDVVNKEAVKEIIKYEAMTTTVDNIANETTNSEESSPYFITMILFIINVLCGKKKTDVNLIIKQIQKQKSWIKYILYFVYFVLVIPVFIDVILIIINIVKTKKI